MTIALRYHPQNPRERLARIVAVLTAIAASSCVFAMRRAHGDEPTRYGRPEACTVLIGGCSGVCVSSAGHILTAGHCDCDDPVDVKWPGGVTTKARKVFDAGTAEGVEVFDCEGDGYPYMAVAPVNPRSGETVYSYGYPVRSKTGPRALECGKGKLQFAEVFDYKGSTVYANITDDMGVAPGWSGGPLINARGEVIGVLHGFQRPALPGVKIPIPGLPKENAWIGWSTVREACEATFAPPETLTVYVWASGCGHCERFKKDCESVDMDCLTGAFAGMPVQFRYTAGVAPRFAIHGKVKEGYAGKADLLTWIQKSRPAPRREPEPQPTPAPRKRVEIEQTPEPIADLSWRRQEEQRLRRAPRPEPIIPPTDDPLPDDQYQPVPQVEPDIAWDGVRVIACFRLDFDGFLPLRGLGAAKAEELLEKVCDERGLPVRVKIMSRSLNPDAYDRFADSVGGLERIQIVALVPEDADKSGLFKSLIVRKIESVAESYLEGTALKVVFERRDAKTYDAALAGVMSYTHVPGEDGEPFKLGEAGIVAILTRRLRIAEGLKNLVLGWINKAKGVKS